MNKNRTKGKRRNATTRNAFFAIEAMSVFFLPARRKKDTDIIPDKTYAARITTAARHTVTVTDTALEM